jgi:hypothetical protein
LIKNSEKVSYTERRDTLSREKLVQLIYQHLYTKPNTFKETIQLLEKETGIKCKNNNFKNKDNNEYVGKQSTIKTLLSMGSDLNNPNMNKIQSLKEDIEVEATQYVDSSIDYDDVRKNFWEEIQDEKINGKFNLEFNLY